MPNKIKFFLPLLFFLSACQPEPTFVSTELPRISDTYPETIVQTIPLTGELETCKAEISGMTWYGDYLILLPQYPDFFLSFGEAGDGALFAIRKADIDNYLDGADLNALEAIKIPVDLGDADKVAGYEGFEAIIFSDNNVYLTIEANYLGEMSAHLLKGKIDPDFSKITLDSANIVEIETQSGILNASDEALLFVEDQLFVIHEANGVSVNARPVVHLFDTDLNTVGTLPFPNIEYRITDVTNLDENNRFWAINYFYLSNDAMLPERDPIVDEFGQGRTHAESEGVERLLEFVYTPNGIMLTDTPPIVFELLANGDLRNWEGIVRYEDGFLLVTDKYPCTVLGYVPME